MGIDEARLKLVQTIIVIGPNGQKKGSRDMVRNMMIRHFKGYPRSGAPPANWTLGSQMMQVAEMLALADGQAAAV